MFSADNLIVIGLAPLAKHLFSFIDMHLCNYEYKNITPWQQVTKPFWTTLPIITVLVLVSFFGQYIMLVVFLVLKTIVEYNMIYKDSSKN